jgi:phosphate transport system protein
MRNSFEEDLKEISNELQHITNLVLKSVTQATESLLFADREIAEKVIESDVLINDLTSALEEKCILVTALQNPVASDLRTVLGALKMATSLERMGDLAVHIAKAARLRYPSKAIPEELVDTFRSMGHYAEKIVEQTHKVLATHELSIAKDIEASDDKLDEIHRELFRIVLSVDWNHGVEAAVDVTLLSRYYERFGDHAVSIARRVIHVVTGEPYLDTIMH